MMELYTIHLKDWPLPASNRLKMPQTQSKTNQSNGVLSISKLT